MGEIEVTAGMTPEDWQKLIRLVESKVEQAKENWAPAVEEWTQLAKKVRAMAPAAPKRETGPSLQNMAMTIASYLAGGGSPRGLHEYLTDLLLSFAAEIERRAREAK